MFLRCMFFPPIFRTMNIEHSDINLREQKNGLPCLASCANHKFPACTPLIAASQSTPSPKICAILTDIIYSLLHPPLVSHGLCIFHSQMRQRSFEQDSGLPAEERRAFHFLLA